MLQLRPAERAACAGLLGEERAERAGEVGASPQSRVPQGEGLECPEATGVSAARLFPDARRHRAQAWLFHTAGVHLSGRQGVGEASRLCLGQSRRPWSWRCGRRSWVLRVGRFAPPASLPLTARPAWPQAHCASSLVNTAVLAEQTVRAREVG